MWPMRPVPAPSWLGGAGGSHPSVQPWVLIQAPPMGWQPRGLCQAKGHRGCRVGVPWCPWARPVERVLGMGGCWGVWGAVGGLTGVSHVSGEFGNCLWSGRGREALSQLWNNLSCKCTAGVRGSSVPGGAGRLHWGCIGGCTGASLGLDPLRTTEMCGGDGPGPAQGQAGNGHHLRDLSSSTAPVLVLKPAWSPGGHSRALSGFGGRDGAGESWQRVTVVVSYLDLLFQERPVLDTPSPSPGNGRRTWAGVAQPGPVMWDPSPAPAFRSAELVWSRTASRIRVPLEGKAGPLPGP